MIDNADQDEWFNLPLFRFILSKHKSRYETRYDTGYKIRTRTKESRSIDRAETENQDWTQRSLDTKLSWIQTLRTRITPKPVPDHLLKKDQFVDGSLHHLPIPSNQEPGSVCVRVRWDGPIFQPIFSSQRTGNEVSFNFVSKIRRQWNKTRLIGNIIADQVQVQVLPINKLVGVKGTIAI
jgi:hypothetical protein